MGNTTTYPTFLSSREIHNNSLMFNKEEVKGERSRGRVVVPPRR